ncbi:RAMP superfamily CRISPR-associated protein [Aerosakkonema funiforme]|uniref:CRISPR-associated protein n=2 Tax=Oscillatoriophycideae TaxID=1301283 RepID=A0A926ZH97_9CYAN|nr:RAMP superfamily CRISPR-associated protein [Aerosakkonema funiforme]MBD2182394.1 CRISPR-associated protein [Aerosakkonema funiforme FACHB-1375]
MTDNRPIRRPQPNPTPETNNQKPYQLISLPSQPPPRDKPIGQDRFKSDRISGTISLRLTVKTATFVASGVTAMGSDLSGNAKNIPLIKTAVGRDRLLTIPGSSLKGVVRSAYEAITRSCLCKTKAESNQIPNGYRECKDNTKLCPACQVFGAMDWQGLIRFSDAILNNAQWSVGFMPSLYAPRKQRAGYYINGRIAGRKFYYHFVKSIDKGQQGIPVQQAGKELIFTTQVGLRNLSLAELGTLLIVLGQDSKNPIALKVGSGKPIGMGTMVVEVTEIQRIEKQKEWRDRYCNYNTSPPSLTGNSLKEFIRKAIELASTQLVQSQQLQELRQVLQWPTTREPIDGVY